MPVFRGRGGGVVVPILGLNGSVKSVHLPESHPRCPGNCTPV